MGVVLNLMVRPGKERSKWLRDMCVNTRERAALAKLMTLLVVKNRSKWIIFQVNYSTKMQERIWKAGAIG